MTVITPHLNFLNSPIQALCRHGKDTQHVHKNTPQHINACIPFIADSRKNMCYGLFRILLCELAHCLFQSCLHVGHSFWTVLPCRYPLCKIMYPLFFIIIAHHVDLLRKCNGPVDIRLFFHDFLTDSQIQLYSAALGQSLIKFFIKFSGKPPVKQKITALHPFVDLQKFLPPLLKPRPALFHDGKNSLLFFFMGQDTQKRPVSAHVLKDIFPCMADDLLITYFPDTKRRVLLPPAFLKNLLQRLRGEIQFSKIIISSQLHGFLYHLKFLIAAYDDHLAVQMVLP